MRIFERIFFFAPLCVINESFLHRWSNFKIVTIQNLFIVVAVALICTDFNRFYDSFDIYKEKWILGDFPPIILAFVKLNISTSVTKYAWHIRININITNPSSFLDNEMTVLLPFLYSLSTSTYFPYLSWFISWYFFCIFYSESEASVHKVWKLFLFCSDAAAWDFSNSWKSMKTIHGNVWKQIDS